MYKVYLTYPGTSLKVRAMLLKEHPNVIHKIEANGLKFEGKLPIDVIKHIKETLRINVTAVNVKRNGKYEIQLKGETNIDDVPVKCVRDKLGKGEEDITITIKHKDKNIVEERTQKVVSFMEKHTGMKERSCRWAGETIMRIKGQENET